MPVPGPLPFEQALRTARAAVEEFLDGNFARFDGQVAEAMAYAVKGGKGLRGFLVIESARVNGVALEGAVAVAAAIECIHAYSLVHDDLPCMDDDDLRRGQPTVHRRWDEATAVLAGDALQALAFELVADSGLPAEATVDLIRNLARASGIEGMVGGQAKDIAAETAETPLTLDEIIDLQAGKTGALITWSASAGAWMAGENPSFLEDYGDALGLAFQIWDDVLDVEGDAALVGKAVGKDADAGKATFVSLLGLDEAKRRAEQLVTEACDALSIYGDDGECLRQAARFVISRQN
ncbi:Farnesyl diphosphate synthase [Pelagimonas phthalicica]|uniref:Geranylgeranyl diphosphate synthase n=1 Tax=Pelagimonas phthalicica TaxID=1037362 RepID=A0A238JAU3_9RHOB|nr:farnesyl diphosphate synthase [Pelagimonas phthalicica]SMX27082.1 Farnesyl diphosphate synthase [Pelagimonas phthalicica]